MELAVRTIAGVEGGETTPTPKNLRAMARLFGEEYDRLLAMAQGLPLPEPRRRHAQQIEVSDETAEALEILSGEAGMSPGQYVDAIVRMMGKPLAHVARAAINLPEKDSAYHGVEIIDATVRRAGSKEGAAAK